MKTANSPPCYAAIAAVASILCLTSASAGITVTTERRTSGLSTNGTFVFNTIPSNTSDDLANGKTFTVLAGSAHAASGPITSDPDFFIFTYRRTNAADADPNSTIAVEYGSDLAGWTTAVAGPNIEISVDNDAAGVGIDLVEVKIRRTLATDLKLFARLKVVVAAP